MMVQNKTITKLKGIKLYFISLLLLAAAPVLAQTGQAEKNLTANEISQKASVQIDPELYSRKALQKTADLGTYLAIISDRNNSVEEANKAVELAVKLFIDENAEIEVSSPEERSRYKVRAYLNRLKLLNYDKVEISWTDISYVSDLKKGIDGNYYGVITLQQRFKGFIDNEVVYGDLTEKNIEVMLVPYQKEINGEQQQKWDVFLSDVGVVVTKFDQ
jgi:Asp-tRNA(Asn)/Glu-tRNA(Gln) amidotransferase A subunit family amidase